MYDNKFYIKVSILLILNAVEDQQLEGLYKIYVQKLTYLLQVLTPILHTYFQVIEFEYYRYGPYSKEIDDSTKYLVFKNLIEPIQVRRTTKNLQVKFAITQNGKNLITELKKKYSILEIYDKVASVSVFYANYYGFQNLTKMTYQEPNFKNVKKFTFIPFDIDSNKTFSLFESMKDYFQEKELNFSFESFCGIFFDLLFQKQLPNSKYIEFDWSFS